MKFKVRTRFLLLLALGSTTLAADRCPAQQPIPYRLTLQDAIH